MHLTDLADCGDHAVGVPLQAVKKLCHAIYILLWRDGGRGRRSAAARSASLSPHGVK